MLLFGIGTFAAPLISSSDCIVFTLILDYFGALKNMKYLLDLSVIHVIMSQDIVTIGNEISKDLVYCKCFKNCIENGFCACGFN